MENKVHVLLPKNLIAIIVKLPEQGMGYHIVDIILANGEELKNKFVFNSSILELEKQEVFDINDIVTIKIHE